MSSYIAFEHCNRTLYITSAVPRCEGAVQSPSVREQGILALPVSIVVSHCQQAVQYCKPQQALSSAFPHYHKVVQSRSTSE